MSRRDEAVDLLRKGNSPLLVAKTMGVTMATVIGYLLNKIGEGTIRRSDVLFAVPRETRQQIESAISRLATTNVMTLAIALRKEGLDVELVKVYLQFRDARFVRGEMYELIADLEVRLHQLTEHRLRSQLGDDSWWRAGVPEGVRVECAASRERDPEPLKEVFGYTTIMQLSKVIEFSWEHIRPALPKQVAANKKQFVSDLARLNSIRNAVMHPVRGVAPTEIDFEFVRGLHALVAPPSVPSPARQLNVLH